MLIDAVMLGIIPRPGVFLEGANTPMIQRDSSDAIVMANARLHRLSWLNSCKIKSVGAHKPKFRALPVHSRAPVSILTRWKYGGYALPQP